MARPRLPLKRLALPAAVVLVCVGLVTFGFLGLGKSVSSSPDSNSMSHADQPLRGVIDPGESVVVDSVDGHDEVVTYPEGRSSGHRIGDDWGDVLIFDAEGLNKKVLIAHRVYAWVVYNATADAYDIPELNQYGQRYFLIPEVGTWDREAGEYVHISMVVELDPAKSGRHDGYLTKGDHNNVFDQDARASSPAEGSIHVVRLDRIDGRVTGHLDREDALFLGFGAMAVAVAGGYAYVKLAQPLRRAAKAARGTRACPRCSATPPDGSPFCHACGEPLPEPPAPGARTR